MVETLRFILWLKLLGRGWVDEVVSQLGNWRMDRISLDKIRMVFLFFVIIGILISWIVIRTRLDISSFLGY